MHIGCENRFLCIASKLLFKHDGRKISKAAILPSRQNSWQHVTAPVIQVEGISFLKRLFENLNRCLPS